jgi:hypothetical protein
MALFQVLSGGHMNNATNGQPAQRPSMRFHRQKPPGRIGADLPMRDVPDNQFRVVSSLLFVRMSCLFLLTRAAIHESRYAAKCTY